MEKKNRLLLILLGVALAVSLILGVVLLLECDAQRNRIAEQESQLTTSQQQVVDMQMTLTGTKEELARVNDQLTAANDTVASLEQELSAAQAALAEMTAARDAAQSALEEKAAACEDAEMQLSSVQEELAACQAEMQVLMEEKAAIDAAFEAAGFARIPPLVESMTEEEIVQDAPVAGDAADDPAEEFFSDTPVDEPYVSDVIMTVYTADVVGVAFEAPVDWIIDDDVREGCYLLRSADEQNSEGYELFLYNIPYSEEAFEYEDKIHLLGSAGVYSEYDTPDGRMERIVSVRVDDDILCVCFTGPCEDFGHAVETLLQPILDSMRLIP
ncbi:MAG: hypothetical protein IJE07_14380 [Clostridia bacterium]|nr:hypothetical protein [Clostridia bacterium]